MRIDGCESDDVIFEVDAFEGGVMVGEQTYEAVHAVGGVECGGEDDDIALFVVGGHGVADDAGGEGIGIGKVRGGDVFIGDACGVVEVGEFGGVAGGDFVDEWDGGEGLGWRVDVIFVVELVGVFLEVAGGIDVVEVDGAVGTSGAVVELLDEGAECVADAEGECEPLCDLLEVAGVELEGLFKCDEDFGGGWVIEFVVFDGGDVGGGASGLPCEFAQGDVEFGALFTDCVGEWFHGDNGVWL